MKKVFLMLAIAASVMLTGCGKGDGNNAAGDSAAVEAVAGPDTIKLNSASSSGEFFKVLGCKSDDIILTKGAEAGDQVEVTMMVTLESREPMDVKEIEMCKASLSYRDASGNSADVTPLDLDKGEYEGVMAMIKEGKEGNAKAFKFTGKMPKAEIEALKGAEARFLNLTSVHLK
ncbi:MAG: hypothetical protein Q4B68_07360 [Bacteroidales bacterium]|nr:hypothetical protein [Bacteroidales bacterium]